MGGDHPKSGISEVFDRQGQLLGVFLDREIWELVRAEVRQTLAGLEHKNGSQVDLGSEPLKDWDTLVKYWDFQYPVEYGVNCEVCDSSTANWLQDEPRLFVLKAASLGGLVSFQCLKCSARIIKRHFKDHISVETRPAENKE